MRFNFTMSDSATLRRAVGVLAGVLSEALLAPTRPDDRLSRNGNGADPNDPVRAH